MKKVVVRALLGMIPFLLTSIGIFSISCPFWVDTSLLVPVNEIMCSDILVLVNREKALSSEYYAELSEFKGHKVSKVVVTDLENMFEDAKKDGVTLNINTAYRDREYQNKIYEYTIKEYEALGMSYKKAKKETEKKVLVPGHSEHETGLAIDFSLPGNSKVNWKMWNWLFNNAHRYGFVLRYPKDKVDVTGISYEPWHYRYVGSNISQVMKENSWTLEEYLAKRQEALIT